MNYSDIISVRFDFYTDIRFWISFLAAFVLFRALASNNRVRNTALVFLNIVFLFALPQFTFMIFLFMLCITVLTYAAGYYLNRKEIAVKRLWFVSVCVGFVIAVLMFFKYSYIQSIFFQNVFQIPFEASDFIFLIGISYSSFKMIHFLIESYGKKIEHMNFFHYLNYIFFFPAFISGPIMRYNHFVDQLAAETGTKFSSDLKAGAERLVHGLFKKFVLSMVVYRYSIVNIQSSMADAGAGSIILGLYAYTLYVYFDFAGYTDLAIGCAKIMGYELPENFNNPFMRRNIQELWANWHMSLTRWLTDYIYWPLSRKLRNIRYFRKRPIFLSNISIIVTFIICGMWHGPTINFVIWGFYHGVGLAILNIYRKYKRGISNKHMQRYFQSRISTALGVFATFNFFVFGISLFALRMDAVVALLRRLLNL